MAEVDRTQPALRLYPMLFMYVTTMAAIVVTGYNLYASILSNPKIAAQPINSIGAVAMIIVAGLLFIAALRHRVRRAGVHGAS